jgi:hypothetical protein
MLYVTVKPNAAVEGNRDMERDHLVGCCHASEAA